MDNYSFVEYDPIRDVYNIDDSQLAVGSSFSTRLLVETLYRARQYAKGKLLDIGCGEKPYFNFFSVDHHIGIDWPQSGHNLRVDVYSDAQILPFADQSFDTILCTEVIEHLPSPETAVTSIKRVLKPGGYLILSAPFIFRHHEFPHDYYRFTYFGLKELICREGLQLIAIWERGGVYSALIDLSSRSFAGWLRSTMRRMHTPIFIQNFLFCLMIQIPQRMIAAVIQHNPNYSDDTGSVLKAPSAFSIGYTLVAQRPVDEK